MKEDPEKHKEQLSEEQEATAGEWLPKYVTEEIPPEKRRECGPEVAELEEMFQSFEQKHDVAALYAITELTPDDAPKHPVREPAKLDLVPIYAKLRTILEETNITPEQYAELKAKWKHLTQAVGLINNNVVDHSAR
jgi:hypothetical protein